MTFKPTFKTRILNGDFSLSAKLANMSLPTVVDMLDPTTFADQARRVQPGLDTSTLACDGFIDADTATDSAAWTSAQPFTYGHEGIALGDPVTLVNALKSSYELGSPVAGLSSFSLAGQTDGRTDFGRSLHDLTAETATGQGTGYDQTVVSTTSGGIGHLHVTAFSGLTSVAVLIEDSANNSTWATIGTFTQVTATGSQRLEITGTVRRYVRASWTIVGTGSCTFAVAFARI